MGDLKSQVIIGWESCNRQILLTINGCILLNKAYGNCSALTALNPN